MSEDLAVVRGRPGESLVIVGWSCKEGTFSVMGWSARQNPRYKRMAALEVPSGMAGQTGSML